MYHPDIDAWLAAEPDIKRLEEMEIKAAEAWFETLSPAQREVYARLAVRGRGLYQLQSRLMGDRVRDEMSTAKK